jgi:hypothetical protein
MLHQGNGNDSVDGFYERDRLRRMAKKLGLRLVKTQVRRSEETARSAALQPNRRLGAMTIETNAAEAAIQGTELDKCG